MLCAMVSWSQKVASADLQGAIFSLPCRVSVFLFTKRCCLRKLEVTGEFASQCDFQSWAHRHMGKALPMWAGSACLGQVGRQGTGASESPGSFSVLPELTIRTPTAPSLPLRCWGLKQEHNERPVYCRFKYLKFRSQAKKLLNKTQFILLS